MENKGRIIYLDALRIFACLCVIFTHINERGQFMFAFRELGSLTYFVEMFVSIVTKAAVPVFFAISGALVLRRETPLKKLWLNKILKMGVTLTVFSGLFYIDAVLSGAQTWSFKTFVFGLYDAQWHSTYWYLYAYLAFLVASPVLSSLVRGMSNRDYLYMLAIAFAFRCLLPGMEQLRWEGMHRFNMHFNLACVTSDIVFYPCLGYYLHHRISDEQCRRWAPALGAAAVLLTMVSCYMTYRETLKVWTLHVLTYHDLFAPAVCAAVFAGARALFAKIRLSRRMGLWITELAGCTLGVYLLHILIIKYLQMLLDSVWGMFMGAGLPQLLASALYCVLIFVLCAVPVWALKRIPVIRNLLE